MSPRISASKLLADLPLVPTKVHITEPVEMRLESLVTELMNRAKDLGLITRGEVVGTLLLAHRADDDLVDRLRAYRDTATAGDAVPGRNVITPPQRKRGRPRRRP